MVRAAGLASARRRNVVDTFFLTATNFSANRIPFKKMYGLGNDFIVLDARKDASVRAALLAKSSA